MPVTGSSLTLRQPVLFLPHGGGPCFFMDWPNTWDKMAAYLRNTQNTLPRKPDAILVVSGHWEENIPTLTAAPHPSLIYDYYGFPPHTYQLQYPAPGSPPLATAVCKLLHAAGIPCTTDDQRGFDHGVFIPFMLAFAEADIPIVELSLLKSMDPAAHIALGAALEPLRAQNVLIVGTGMTYHNLRHFMNGSPVTNQAAQEFDTWLEKAMTAPPAERTSQLIHWASASGARICHPREEHLLPLMVAAGAAGKDKGIRTYKDTIMGKALAGFRFG
ncbi:dioxygenase [Acetobacter pomorum]|uniref:Dioxygenase n=1 Tax=Acetobacter pomorum TaxID=65959 RepID=A0A2G4RB82_9PROT|nr:class III extradiol ring-cleavage dioxygenase [Acetobacter pomorum]PHY93813.1 dioxygenase [Acetobacter pomorum]